jgi:CheY-like chemotaxis protein/signal transduction histidine kinase
MRRILLTNHIPRVLIVDDEPRNRRVIEVMLRSEGYAISTAESGAEALALIAVEPPDLILLDLMMPGMTGYEVTASLKRASKTLHIPIILVSALADHTARIRGLEAGAEDFLTKPVNRAELQARVKNLLKLKAFGDFYGRYSKSLEEEVRDGTEKLRESEAFLGAAIDALPVHISIIDPSGNCIAVNESWKRFGRENGLAGDDFNTGFNYLLVCDAHSGKSEDAKAAAHGIRSVIAGDSKEFVMNYTCHSPIEKRWFTMRATAFDSTLPASVVVTHYNVTERKHMETELLHKQKLESMGLLAGGVAHDFNNILTVIKSYGDLLLSEVNLHPTHRHDIEEISRAAERAANLTKQLLAFSRKETVSPRVFDLNAALLTTQAMLVRLIGEDIELNVEVDEGMLPISIDPTHLEQVVVNLAINARDAMPKGGVLTLRTRLCNLEPECAELGVDLTPGAFVTLYVSDTGCGMDAAVLSRLFEPFFTTKAEGLGTGLGLSTVFGIVTQAGGAVHVNSVVGTGTTFSLYFPLAEMVSPEVLAPAKAAVRTKKDARILFVEDEESLRKLGTRILNRNGFSVRVAANCEEALLVCEEESSQFDLACIDVVMPGTGGGELAVLLLEKYPSLKIVMMSGFNDDELLRRGIGDHKIPFLQKPYSPTDLVSKIREVLATGSSQASPYLRLA